MISDGRENLEPTSPLWAGQSHMAKADARPDVTSPLWGGRSSERARAKKTGWGEGYLHFLRLGAATAIAALIVSPATAREAVPDFSGIWGRNSVDFEPPASGPGPVMNRTRTFYMRIGDDTNPILKPEAAAKVRAAAATSRTNVNFTTPSNQCTPWSPPYVWRALQMQMVQEKDRITIVYVGDQQVRQIRLNAEHPTRVTPTWKGDSVGHYEGDTLVIDTVGIKAGPGAMLDNYATPYTEGLHLIERIRLIDGEEARRAAEQSERNSGRVEVDMGGASIDPSYKGKGLRIEIRVEDPAVFTMPWSEIVTYQHHAGPWEERVCADMRFNYIDGKDIPVPRAAQPDF
jgi:hypothetical protein